MSSESTQITNLIQKKLAEKDEIIREQMQQITELEARVAELESGSGEVQALRARVAELEARSKEYEELRTQLQQLLGE